MTCAAKLCHVSDPNATRLGRTLVNFAGSLEPAEVITQIFSDVFAPKSTGTLMKRSHSLWTFCKFLRSKQQGNPFSQREATIYQFLCFMRSSNFGATAPSHFLEAMRFADAMLGFVQPLEITPRIKGAAHAQYVTKRRRKPARVLTLDMVKELERICIHGDLLRNRVLAGSMLFCIFAGSRWHDSLFVATMQVAKHADIVLLEADTSRHKTSLTKELQAELLPFTAVATAFDDASWGESFATARQDAGFQSAPFFTMSWSDVHSTWSGSRMSTGEATCWLRELLQPAFGRTEVESLTIHGCKATLLSWCAKSLMFTPDEQSLLGHHVPGQHKSALLYSRDTQIALCAKIHVMLQRMRDNSFNPDKPRAERLFELVGHAASEVEKPSETSQRSETSSSSSSDCDISDSVSDDSADVKENLDRSLPEGCEGGNLWVHKFSSVVHHVKHDDDTRLMCGRSISCNFRKAKHQDISDAPMVCAMCSSSLKALE